MSLCCIRAKIQAALPSSEIITALNQKRFVNLNGKLISDTEVLLPIHNTAFRSGMGLFETMLLTDGQIRLAPYHEQRLLAGMNAMGFSFPAHTHFQTLLDACIRTAQKNGLLHRARIRLQVFSIADGLFEPCSPVGFLVECYPINEALLQWNEHGLTVGLYEGGMKTADSFSGYKTTNALVYALAAKHARTMHWNDALILNHHQQIIETAIANLFWIRGGQIYTPPLASGCIDGVMRRYLLEQLPALGFSVLEENADAATLQAADELFITNAIRGIKWVGYWGDKTFTYSLTYDLTQRLSL